MLDNCLIIDKDRWDLYSKEKVSISLMYLMDFLIVKGEKTFMFYKNRYDGLTKLEIPNEYLPAILSYYKSVTSN